MSTIIHYATGNAGKLASLKAVLEPLGFEVKQLVMNLTEPQLDSITAIAKHKAIHAFGGIHRPVVVQDSGFVIPALGGFPGPYTKYALETLGVPGILRAVGTLSRKCFFHECLAYKDEDKIKVFETFIHGTLTTKKYGSSKDDATSELWRVFIPDGQEKTISQMSDAERNTWRNSRETDHYGVQFAQWFKA